MADHIFLEKYQTTILTLPHHIWKPQLNSFDNFPDEVDHYMLLVDLSMSKAFVAPLDTVIVYTCPRGVSNAAFITGTGNVD